MFKKLLALALVAIMLVSVVACTDPGAELKGMSESPLAAAPIVKDFEVAENFKLGVICLHDEQSTYDLNFLNGVAAMQEALGLSNDQVIIKTMIDETEECYEAAADLVDQDCTIIFANSFGHEDFMIQAAKEFPDVQFCHATGVKAAAENLPNYHNAFASIYEGRYLAGIAAGMKLNEMIEAGKFTAEEAKIGYVGAFTYAEVISGYTSFYLGARSVCPTVTMEVTFTGEWFDITAENNAAKALIARGCKLISQHADSMGAPSACEAAGVPNVSYNGSTYETCKNSFIVSSRIDWAPYFAYIVKCMNTGAAIDTNWCGGIAEGSVALTGINLDVAADGTVEAIKAAIDQFKAGTLNVFDTNKFTVADAKVETYLVGGVEVIENGIFMESKIQSAPYFDLRIDGITLLDENYG